MIVFCAWQLLNLSLDAARKEEMLSNFASVRSYMEEKSRREKLSKKKLKVIRQKSQGEQEVYAQAKGIVAKTCLKLFMC